MRYAIIIAMLAASSIAAPDLNITMREGGIVRADACILAMDYETGIADDLSGGGNDGTISGAVHVPATATTSGLMSFNGVDEKIQMTLDTWPAVLTDITISFWANPQTPVSPTAQYSLVADSINAGDNRIWIALPWESGATDILYWDFGDVGGGGRLSVNWNHDWDNEIAFWVFTSEAGIGQKIYRNNIELASDGDADSFTKGSATLYFAWLTVRAEHWRGLLDEPMIHSSALTESERESLYFSGVDRHRN